MQPDSTLAKVDMESSAIRSVGVLCLVLSFFLAIWPLKHFVRQEPSMEILQNAKGSWIPDAFVHLHAGVFLAISGFFLIGGLLALALSKFLEGRESKTNRKGLPRE